MPCYFPLTAIRQQGVYKAPLVFTKDITKIINKGYEKLKIPCGQCIGCKLEKSRQMAIRMQHEASISPKGNCFLTLTYDNEHLPHIDGIPSLDKTHLQNFMKYVRRDCGPNIRFYGAGEYGLTCYKCGNSRLLCTCKTFLPDLGRPHYHLCLFNHRFTDEQLIGLSASGYPVLQSPHLEKLWGKGRTATSDFTFETAAYCARYVTKKVNGKKEKEHYDGRIREFALMSRRPGIGRRWYDQYVDPIYQNDMVVIRNNLICRPPKYYDYLYEQVAPLDMEELKRRRREKALIMEQHTTPERMTVRNTLAELKHKRLQRSFENE